MNKSKTSTGRNENRVSILYLIALTVFFILSILVDGFLLHPIPAPKGTFDLNVQTPPRFDLTQSNSPYAQANIVDSCTADHDVKIYLVEQDGELHLLNFRTHFVTERTALKDDILIGRSESSVFQLGWIFNRATIEVRNGRIVQCVLNSGQYLPSLMLFIYFLVAAFLTVLVAVIAHLFKRYHRRVHA